jgi:hypothetical protein
MLALGEWADDGGRCWPSIGSIAKKARISERTAQYTLRSLASSNYVEIEEQRGRGNTCTYTINLPYLKEKAQTLHHLPQEKVQELHPLEVEKVQSGAEKVQVTTEKVQPIAPDPLERTVSIEPSVKRARTKTSSPNPTPIPDDFAPTPEMLAKAKAKYPGMNILAASEAWVGSMRANTRRYQYTNWVQAWWNGLAFAEDHGLSRLYGGNGNGTHRQNGTEVGIPSGPGQTRSPGLRDLLEKRTSAAKGT